MISIYRKLFELLTPPEQRRFYQLLAMIVVMGLLDMIGVASILPFLAVVSNPDLIATDERLQKIFNWFGFMDRDSFLIFLGSLVFMIVIVSTGFRTLTLYAMARFSQMRNHSISTRLMASYFSQPYVWFLHRHSSDLGKSVLSEVQNLVWGSLMPAMRLLAQLTTLICLVSLLMVIEPVVAIVAAIVLGGAYATIFASVRRYVSRMGKTRMEANQQQFQIAQEAFGGIKEVKLMGLEGTYLSRFRKPSRLMATSSAGVEIVSELPRQLLEAVTFGGMLALILVLLLQEGGSITNIIPMLGVFAFAGLRMFPAIQVVYGSMTMIRSTYPTLESVHRDLMEARTESFPTSNERINLRQSLVLNDVRYTYPKADRPALCGLSLTIPAKRTVGIVGGTGAGKTSTVDVVLGLLEPQSGDIQIDGKVMDPANLRAWQNSIGYVPQNIYLIDDTVAANIAFGIPPEARDQASVERAARIANLHDFIINELPLGYEAMVGERGVRLSGGQRQRIGIARALYHDPDVLILDEATSSLDNLTERAVMEAVHNLDRNKTIIMIAHRLSTVKDCAVIFLLDKGRLSAQGTYEQLVRENDEFRRMAAS